MESPAPLLSGLFPDDVITAAAAPCADHEGALFDEERSAIARAVERRRHEFATGRACARRAMAALGVAPAPLLNDGERAPIWPDGVMGSISHTRGLCAVALARPRPGLVSLGLDVEPDAEVRPALWDRICRPEERRFVEALPTADHGRVVRVLFSAKEAFYKCQHRVSRRFLGFQAARVDLRKEEGRFTVELLQEAAPFPPGTCFEGRLEIGDGFVRTAVTWPG